MNYNHDVAGELIRQNIARLLAALPEGVEVVAAAKTRTPEEVLEAVQAGVRIIGENYVNDAKGAHELVGKRAKWHFIGTLRKHNIRKPVLEIFDMIESVDSFEIAQEIGRVCSNWQDNANTDRGEQWRRATEIRDTPGRRGTTGKKNI